jgi:hypothetical protein
MFRLGKAGTGRGTGPNRDWKYELKVSATEF